jgi:hypothetical protein
MTTFCDAHPADLTGCLMAALRAAAELSPDARRDSGFEELAALGAGALRDRLDRPERADDDWSLALPDGCSCQLCATLATFLRDPARRTLEWPLAKPRRQHIHGRTGSPRRGEGARPTTPSKPSPDSPSPSATANTSSCASGTSATT